MPKGWTFVHGAFNSQERPSEEVSTASEPTATNRPSPYAIPKRWVSVGVDRNDHDCPSADVTTLPKFSDGPGRAVAQWMPSCELRIMPFQPTVTKTPFPTAMLVNSWASAGLRKVHSSPSSEVRICP